MFRSKRTDKELALMFAVMAPYFKGLSSEDRTKLVKSFEHAIAKGRERERLKLADEITVLFGLDPVAPATASDA